MREHVTRLIRNELMHRHTRQCIDGIRYPDSVTFISRARSTMSVTPSKRDAPTTPAFCIALLSSSLSCVASTVAKSLVTVMSLGLSKRSPTDRLSGHSGNPALRRLWTYARAEISESDMRTPLAGDPEIDRQRRPAG